MLSEVVRGLRLAGGMMRTVLLIPMRMLEGEMNLLHRPLAQLDLDSLKDQVRVDVEKVYSGNDMYVPHTRTLAHCILPHANAILDCLTTIPQLVIEALGGSILQCWRESNQGVCYLLMIHNDVNIIGGVYLCITFGLSLDVGRIYGGPVRPNE